MVSVVVPVYNSERYLDDCIRSILVQSFVAFELLLVDDGSTDSSLEVCRKYSYDPRVKVFTKTNGGAASARNYGVAKTAANSTHVFFCDSDDQVMPNYLHDMMMFSEKCDCVICNVRHIKGGETYLTDTPVRETTVYEYPYENEAFLSLFRTGVLNSPCNKMYSLGIIRKHNLRFDTNIYNEDISYNVEYFRYCEKIIFVTKDLYIYKHREGSITSTPPVRHIYDYESLQQKLKSLTTKKHNRLVDDFVSYQYQGYVLRLIKNKEYGMAKDILKRPLVREAMKNHLSTSLVDRLQFDLLRFRMLKIYHGLFLRNS